MTGSGEVRTSSRFRTAVSVSSAGAPICSGGLGCGSLTGPRPGLHLTCSSPSGPKMQSTGIGTCSLYFRTVGLSLGVEVPPTAHLVSPLTRHT